MQPTKEQIAEVIKNTINEWNGMDLSNDDSFQSWFEENLHLGLIKLIDIHNRHNKYPNDFFEKEETRIQPTNPHFAKENWRKK